jgi:hypothetical protein
MFPKITLIIHIHIDGTSVKINKFDLCIAYVKELGIPRSSGLLAVWGSWLNGYKSTLIQSQINSLICQILPLHAPKCIFLSSRKSCTSFPYEVKTLFY